MMDISSIAPDLRAQVRRVPAFPLGNPIIRSLVGGMCRLIPSQHTDGVTITSYRDATPQLRIHVPEVRRSSAALLWIHGGGFLMGNATQDDRLCGETAQELGIPVIATSYRLAPNHPFPAASDDCYAAWRWIQDHAGAIDIDSDCIAIGGQSAGGGLAAGLAQRIRDDGGRQPKAQWLFSPMLDDRTAADRDLDAIGHRVWTNELNAAGWRGLLGGAPGQAQAPAYAVPAREANLANLPEAWIGVGDIDLFYAENIAYAERLHAAGVEVAVEVVAGAPHGFETWGFATTVARAYLKKARDWLRKAVRR